jgi:hypothetical protein
MKFNDKELEYLITYAEQLKVLVPRITYNEQLIKDLFFNMKEKTKVSDDNLHRIENNFIAMDLIGFRTYDEQLRRKIDEYLED